MLLLLAAGCWLPAWPAEAAQPIAGRDKRTPLSPLAIPPPATRML